MSNKTQPKKWTEHEKRFVQENWATMCDKDIAHKLNRTPGAVQGIRKRLGLKNTKAQEIKKTKLKNKTHGLKKTEGKINPIYMSWTKMKSRCYNKNSHAYIQYGGRGIFVCDEWKNSFQKFYNWSINNGWQNGLSIDRIDNSLGYCPSNCRWATKTEQANNRRNTTYITAFGKTLTITEWSKRPECAVSISALRYRLATKTLSPEEIITKPPRRKK